MAGALADAFQELLDANDEACGTPQFIQIDGKQHRAIHTEIPQDEQMLRGGIGEGGQFQSQVAIKDFAQPPEKGASAIVNGTGRELQVLGHLAVNSAVYIVTIGDLAAE
jgi:hypothetical protein